ncbi:MAG: hypothetical protein ACI3XQ_01745 [Eubacteriales bacterium]
MKKIVIGLVGTSQLSFPGDKEKAFARCADGLQKLSVKLGYELVVYPSSVITREDALTAVAYMEERKIDFLMVQHTSYTAGFVAPVMAKIKGARVGFWAIPEGTDSGVVPFNSFCSINMHAGIVAHYLRDYDIPIKWFFGDVEDERFVRRFTVTVRAITAIVNLAQSKVALVGGIAPGFNDLYDDERKLNRRFEGLYFNRLHEYSEIKDRALSYSDADIAPIIKQMKEKSCGILNEHANETLGVSARIYKAYRDFIDEFGYDAIAVSCWPKFQNDFKYSVCSVVGQLNEEGTVMACEGDVLSAVSMLVLKYISGGEATMLMDMSAFDEKDDTVLLWHCGPAASDFCRCSGYKLSVNYHGMAHIPGKGVTSCSGVTRDMVFDENDATVFRISGECDESLSFGGHFVGDAKESFYGSRGWLGDLKLNDNDISSLDLVNTILSKGFPHHFPVVLGNFSEEIAEFCAWTGLSRIDAVPYRNYLQR